jgi:exopolysaccharide biosynthesis polyprenyl glycosylphosphotransferase
VANGVVESKRLYPEVASAESIPTPARFGDPGIARLTATVVADIAALTVSTAMVAAVMSLSHRMSWLGGIADAFPGSAGANVPGLAALTVWTMFVFYAVGLYRKPRRSIGWSTLVEAVRGLTALTTACWTALLLAVAVSRSTESAGELILFWAVAVVSVPTARWLSRRVVWPGPALTERVLVVGAGEVGHLVADKIRRRKDLHMTVVGFLDDGEPRRNGDGPSPPLLGTLKDLAGVIRDHDVTRVIVAFSQARHQRFLDVVRTCADADVRVNIVPRLFEVISSRAGIDEIEGIPLLDVATVELSRFNMLVKRVFDLVFGGLLLVALMPVIGVLAALVKLDSPGSAFFRQERMGRGGSVFRIFKMRSMRDGAEALREDLGDQNEYSGPMFKMKEDPRLTRVGRWMRRWSLDELPQIFNVLRGEMSLVGPRPHPLELNAEFKSRIPKYMLRHKVKPGITGWAQVNGFRGQTDTPEKMALRIQHDLWYIQNWSLWLDLKILLMTPLVLVHRNAY